MVTLCMFACSQLSKCWSARTLHPAHITTLTTLLCWALHYSPHSITGRMMRISPRQSFLRELIFSLIKAIQFLRSSFHSHVQSSPHWLINILEVVCDQKTTKNKTNIKIFRVLTNCHQLYKHISKIHFTMTITQKNTTKKVPTTWPSLLNGVYISEAIHLWHETIFLMMDEHGHPRLVAWGVVQGEKHGIKKRWFNRARY